MLCVTLFVVVALHQGHHQYKVGSRQILKSLEYYRWSAAIYRKYGRDGGGGGRRTRECDGRGREKLGHAQARRLRDVA